MIDFKLRPCPHCASRNLVIGDNSFCQRFVVCGNCGARGPAQPDEERARISWNERWIEDKIITLFGTVNDTYAEILRTYKKGGDEH